MPRPNQQALLRMSRPKKSGSKLEPWNRARVVQEVASHTILLGTAWYAGFGYVGLMLLLALEIPLINVLTMGLYPERGMRRHLGDLIKGTALILFLLLFVVLTAGVAHGDRSGSKLEIAFGAALDLDPWLLAWGVGLTVLHLLALRWQAHEHADSRLQWARLALAQGAVTLVATLILVFAGLPVAGILTPMIQFVWPSIPPDAPLMAVAVALRCALALLVSRMSAEDLDSVARNPYVD